MGIVILRRLSALIGFVNELSARPSVIIQATEASGRQRLNAAESISGGVPLKWGCALLTTDETNTLPSQRDAAHAACEQYQRLSRACRDARVDGMVTRYSLYF